jgi:hypothetical protein
MPDKLKASASMQMSIMLHKNLKNALRYNCRAPNQHAAPAQPHNADCHDMAMHNSWHKAPKAQGTTAHGTACQLTEHGAQV